MEQTELQDIKVGDTILVEYADRYNVILSEHVVEKVTPAHIVLKNGKRYNKETMRLIGNHATSNYIVPSTQDNLARLQRQTNLSYLTRVNFAMFDNVTLQRLVDTLESAEVSL